MSFEEWVKPALPVLSKIEQGQMKTAWNAAIEEAAKVADSWSDVVIFEEIKELKN